MSIFGPAGYGDSRVGYSPDNFSMFGNSGFGGAIDRRIFGGAGNNFGLGAGDRRIASQFGQDPIQRFQAQAAKEAAQWAQDHPQNAGGGTGGAPGAVGNPTGGVWNAVNQWNPQILKASQVTGVPVNVIKAIMSIESEGDPSALSSQGYYGLMQTGPESDVPGYMMDRSWLAADPYNQILAGATELMNKYNMMGGTSWDDAARAYIGLSGTDAYGTDQWAYLQRFQTAMQQLNAAGAGSFSTGANQYAGSGLFGGGGGNTPLPGTQGLFGGSGMGGAGALNTAFGGRWDGNDDFGVESGNGLYGYGTSYGLSGTQHTGMDIMQPLGSTLYAPAGAKVVCVGCWRNDHLTGGVGRIELEMPDGAHVLFDHSNQSYVQEGQTVQAGQAIGTSGGMYSPHTHLEVRVPDGSTESGYRLVDPAQYFAGTAGAPTQGNAQQTYGGNWWDQPLSALLGGR